MISVEAALETILKEINPLGLESVGIASALGRVIGEDISARGSNPPWDNSAMDGYALRAADAKGASPDVPVKLTVLYDLPAGSVPQGPVGPGQAVRIMTGAPVPIGADAVVMVEKTESGDGFVLVKAEPRGGENIRRAGEDFKAGDVVVTKGSLIRPAEVSMLATVGVPFVFVHKKPRVAVISTGDELCDIIEAPAEGKISNSNGYALAALVAASGAVPIQLGIAKDTKESLRQKLTAALSADCIISSGGVSVGDYDFVKDIVPRIGAEVVYKGVAIKPGKHILVAQKEEKFVLALPGFAYSSTVTAILYVLPLIAKMLGRDSAYKTVAAKLSEEFTKRSRLTEFTACNVVVEDGEYFVNFKDKKVGSSAILTNMLNSSALMITGEEDANLSKGTFVNVILLDNF